MQRQGDSINVWLGYAVWSNEYFTSFQTPIVTALSHFIFNGVQ